MNKLLSLLKSFATGRQLKTVHLSKSKTSLRHLVNQVMTGLLPRNLQQKSFIVNDVEKEMLVNNDRNILAEVIRRLLSMTIVCSNDNYIHVSANLSGNTTWLHIKTNDTHRSPATTSSMRKIKLMTEKIGGCVAVTNNDISGTTLAFTFRHQDAA